MVKRVKGLEQAQLDGFGCGGWAIKLHCRPSRLYGAIVANAIEAEFMNNSYNSRQVGSQSLQLDLQTQEKGGHMQDSLMQQGVDLMLYGMGTVVIFLAILVVCTTLMSRIVQRYFAEPDVQAASVKMVEADHDAVDARLLAVIKSALDQHRAKRR